jgi:hypothetical protein
MIKFYELATTKSNNQAIYRLQTSITVEAAKLSHHADFARYMKTLTQQLAHNTAKTEQSLSKNEGFYKKIWLFASLRGIIKFGKLRQPVKNGLKRGLLCSITTPIPSQFSLLY